MFPSVLLVSNVVRNDMIKTISCCRIALPTFRGLQESDMDQFRG